jgi:ParB family chromosome partitioning protein
MSERKGGLGRGLAALIPQGPADGSGGGAMKLPTAPRPKPAPVREAPPAPSGTIAGAVYREVPLDAIKANPKQPRQVFDEDALAELEHSIREFGLMQPIVVRELGHDTYELVMGERRLRAADRG